MTPESLKFLGQLAMALISGGALVAAINNWLSPKVRAETKVTAQQAARDEVESRVQNLREMAAESDRRADAAVARAEAADRRADAADKRADAVEEKVNRLQRLVEDAYEQIDRMADDTRNLRETVKQLRDQNRLLRNQLQVSQRHAEQYFANRGETMPANWPRAVSLTED